MQDALGSKETAINSPLIDKESIGYASETDAEDNNPLELEEGPKSVRDPQYRLEIIKKAYRDPILGYFGVEKTAEKIKRRYHQKGLMKDVESYIQAYVYY